MSFERLLAVTRICADWAQPLSGCHLPWEAEVLRPYLPGRGHRDLVILALLIFVLGGEPLSAYGDHVVSVPVAVF